jgi:hypothetical protein
MQKLVGGWALVGKEMFLVFLFSDRAGKLHPPLK